MGLTPRRALIISAYIIGTAFFLALFRPAIYSTYVPQLQDWQYMRDFYLDGSSSVPVVAEVEFPDLNHMNSDCSDLRFTVGTGASERLLSAYVDCDDHKAYVVVPPFSHSTVFHIYYGNPDASPGFLPSKPSGTVYHAPTFREEDYTYSLSDGADTWGIFKFTHSRLYLLKWGRGSGVLTLPVELRPGTYTRVLIYGRGWGHGLVYIPLVDGNYGPVDLRNYTPSTGILISSSDRGRLDVSIYANGTNIRTYSSRSLDFRFYTGPEKVYVYYRNEFIAALPRFHYLHFLVTGYSDSTEVYLKGVDVKYNTKDYDATFSDEKLTPRSPRITVSSPESNVYYNTLVPISYTVTDPNNDLNSVQAYLDDNLLSTEAEYSNTLDLNDGTHIFRIIARDREGLTTTQTVTFYVDKTPPDLNVTFTYDHPVLHIDLNVYDANPVTCYLQVGDSNRTEINCSSLDVNVDYSTLVKVYAQDIAGNVSVAQTTIPRRPYSGGGGGGSIALPPKLVAETSPVVTVSTSTPSGSTGATLSVSPVAQSFVGVLIVLILIGYILLR